MKIKMILTNSFVADPRVYKEAKYYVSQGHEVEVLCWDRECKYAIEDEEDGIKIHRFHIRSVYGSGMRKQLPAYLKFRKACIKYLKKQKYDVLHCHDLDGAIVGLGVKNSVKKVFDMHEYYLDAHSKPVLCVFAYLVQKAQTKFDHIIYLNDKQKHDVQQQNVSKLLFLPNYPEKGIFNNISKNPSTKIRIGFAGNIRHIKSCSNLVNCCKKYDAIEVHFYGYGDIVDRLEKMADGIKNVFFHGRFKYEELNSIYQNIDIVNCVYDSLGNDGYPNKFFESIATRTPMLVDYRSVRADFVNKYEVGFLVNVDDVSTYYNVIDKILREDGIVQRAARNYANVKEQFFWEDMVVVLDNIVAGKV